MVEGDVVFSYLQLQLFSILQCIILTEVSYQVQVEVDDFCRSQDPPIQVLLVHVYLLPYLV